MGWKAFIAGGWGVLIGALTFAAGPLTAISDHAAVAVVQMVLVCLMIPGLFVASEVGSLIPAAATNALIHFGVCFLVLRFVPAFRFTSVHDDALK